MATKKQQQQVTKQDKPTRLPSQVIGILRRRIKEMSFAPAFDETAVAELFHKNRDALKAELKKRTDKALAAALKTTPPTPRVEVGLGWYASIGINSRANIFYDDAVVAKAVAEVSDKFDAEMNEKYGFARPSVDGEAKRRALLRELDDLVLSTAMQDKANQSAALQAFMDKLAKIEKGE